MKWEHVQECVISYLASLKLARSQTRIIFPLLNHHACMIFRLLWKAGRGLEGESACVPAGTTVDNTEGGGERNKVSLMTRIGA